jgi:hypothetical protein
MDYMDETTNKADRIGMAFLFFGDIVDVGHR